jgi:hypothetical protein
MSYVISVTPEATSEFNESARYYDGEQDGLGDRFIDEVKDAYSRIMNTPEIFPKRTSVKQECVLKNLSV